MITAELFNRRGGGFSRGISSPVFTRRRRRGVINTNPRNIASGVRAPTGTSNGTNTGQNLRSSHYNESGVALTELALIYSGWNIDSTSEVDNPNAYTVTASIEYPAGTFTQVTWSGATSRSIAAGSNVLSDYVTGFNIPAGAQFWVRTYVSVSSGQRWPTCSTYGISVTSGNGELCEIGTSITDKTMGGTITGSSTGLRPQSVMAKWVPGMKKVSLCGFGDSTIHGAGDEAFDTYSNTSWIGRAASGNCPYMMVSFGGHTLLGSNATMSRRLDLITKAGITHVMVSLAANDIASSPSYSTMVTRLQDCWTQLATTGASVCHASAGPRSNTTDNWFTTTNQTADANWNGSTALAHQVNDYMRGLPSPLFYLFDKCDILSTSRYSGIFKTGDSHPSETRLQQSLNLTASGTPTTTNVPFTPSLASGWTNFFTNGRVEFTSGVLSGTTMGGTISNTLTALSTTVALSSAPSAGDTMIGRPSRCRSTTDGIHAFRTTSTVTAFSGQIFGGHMMMADAFIPVIQGWNA